MPKKNISNVEREWRETWAPIVMPKGKLNLEQVKKELFDFSTAMENVPKVYCHITGGRLSYITYPADTVISVADYLATEQLESLNEIMEAKDKEIARLKRKLKGKK